MLYNELNTSLRFYDDVDKQNRYRLNCLAVCDFKQYCPENNVLPFQFMAEYDTTTDVTGWSVLCASDGSEHVDLSLYLDQVNVHHSEDVGTYITYLGAGLGITLGCGDYYTRITLTTDAGEFFYYSEVFTIKDSLTENEFVQSIFPVYSVWTWYDSAIKRIENYEPCNKLCPYTILCGNDALIPFQYRVESVTSVTSWTLSNEDCYVSLDHTLLTVQTVGDYKNIIYNGDLINLPCGVFYSEMVIDGVTHYSEPILITNEFETAGTNYILQETGDLLLQENN
jgi:hypothetical protein